MSQELVSIEDINELLTTKNVGKYSTPEVIKESVTPGWLPYVKFIGGNNEEFEAFFKLVKGRSETKLGSELVIFLLSYRVKAFVFKKTMFAPEKAVPNQSFYNPESEEFKIIKKNVGKKDSGLGFGPELLWWLPEVGELASFYCYNSTFRNESPNMIDNFPDRKSFQLKTHFIDNSAKNGYKWWGFRTFPYDLEVSLPPKEILMENLAKFNDHPDSETFGSSDENLEDVGEEDIRR